MEFSSKTKVLVGQVIYANGTRYKVLKVHDLSSFMQTPFWIAETTEMLFKN